MVSVSVAQELMADNDVRRRPGPNDAAYRRGLDHLFEGRFDESIASFDQVLKADPKHQQAFEIREQAVKRRREGGGSPASSDGGVPAVAIVPLLLGIAGGGYTMMRRRRAQPAPPAAAPASVPAAAGDPLTCSRCGNVHVREVAFCTKCGNAMSATAPAPQSAVSATPSAPAAAAASSSRDRWILIGSVAAVGIAALVFFLGRSGGDEPSVLPTIQPEATAEPRAEGDSIEGQWSSTFGPVTLEHGTIRGDAPVDVTGSWLQGPDKEGRITSGNYDPDARTLEIAYIETWSDVEGTASFELSRDGDTLEGTYEQPGARGAWTLTR
jgi:hypothetical protein